jgi:transcriptional regulator with XRE-family HTH domain
MELDPPIGERIAFYRRRRGLSQEVCAGLVGRTENWLSQIERGVRPLDRLPVLVELARVLRVSLLDLIGNPMPTEPERPRAALVSTLRAVLMRYETIERALVPVATQPFDLGDLNRLRHEVAEANRLYQETRYAVVGELLTGLIVEVRHATRNLRDTDQQRAYGVLAEVYHVTAKTLSRVGEPGLAWIVAERSIAAAAHAETPLLMAASAYHLGQALLRGGHYAEAASVVTRAAESLEQRADQHGPGPLSAIGGLYLTAAMATASNREGAAVYRHLRQADGIADRLGGDRNDLWLAFGPANVAIHRVAAAGELGDPTEAIRRGEAIDLSGLPPQLIGRRCQAMIELARAYAQRRMDNKAVDALMAAERVAPEALRFDATAQATIRQLLGRPRRTPPATLRRLADRIELLG